MSRPKYRAVWRQYIMRRDRCGDPRLVFDAGSGLRMLGLELAEEAEPTDIDLFLSHCHIDHLIGLPFFVPAFMAGNRLRLWAGNLKAAGGVQETVRKLMSYPLFPIELEAAHGKVEFTDFAPGDVLTPRPGIKVMTAALNHPGGATGYRVEFGGRAMAYITDTELSADEIDPALLELARDASIVVIDTTYTDEELPEHVGWGHSSWQQAVRLAMRRASGSSTCFTTIPNTTTMRWTASPPPPPRRGRAPWLQGKGYRLRFDRSACFWQRVSRVDFSTKT